ncbi:MAG TPA: UvrD-helicase domain-containing protein [Planctomycetota bacterium]|nr:UvrD-helicase domain-containing protein [Planctomycetota bacterium]
MARRKTNEHTPAGQLFTDELPEGGVLIIRAAPADAETARAAIPSEGHERALGPFDLTASQTEALDLTGNRVISASAGTGKTHTLTALFLALIEGRIEPGGKLLAESEWLARAHAEKLHPMHPGDIVAVTFTDKAATELLERARKGLDQELKRADLPEKLKDHLARCRKELYSAPVSTIHAFCARMLREAGAGGTAPAGFKVLEQEEAGELYEAALSAAAAELLESEQHPHFQKLVQESGVFTQRTGIAEIGRKLLDALRTRGFGPDELRSKNPATFEDVLCDFESFYDRLAAIPDAGRSRPSAEARARCAARKLPATLDEARTMVLELYTLLNTPSGGLAAWAEKAGLENHFDRTLHAANAPFADALADYAARVKQKYAEAKRKAGGVDYDDLLIGCRELLRPADKSVCATDGDKNVRAAGNYQFVLIDEYQDTNPLQRDIFYEVAFPDGVFDGPPRLGVVGDTKQSIYRFRGAESAIMEDAEQNFARAPLRENFRSRKKLIDFFNAFFEFAWPERAGAQHYDADDKLEAGGSGERHAWDGPAGEAICWEKDDVPGAESHRQQQAFAAARRIRTLVAPAPQSTLTRPKIWDKITNKLREEIRYGDIAILSRSLKHIRIPLQLALSSLRIPFRMLGGVSFFARQEVIDVTNLWAAACEASDSYAVAGLLRSPFVGLSDAGLWRCAGRLEAGAPLAQTVLLCAGDADFCATLNAEDASALQRGAKMLARLSAWRGRRTAFEILDWALIESGFLSVQAMQPRGEVAVAAVRKLIEIARGYEARGNRHLSDFVRWLRKRADAEWDDPGGSGGPELTADLPADEDDAVQIGTIHSAKGLEFPIVFLADAGAASPPMNSWALYSPANGLGLRLGSALDGLAAASDWAHRENAKREAEDEDAERLRLLYVALTRARDYLVVLGEAKAKSSESNWRKKIDDFRAKSPEMLVEVQAKDAQIRAAHAGDETGLLVFEGGTARVREEFAPKGARALDEELLAARDPADRNVCAARPDLRVSVSRLALWLWCPRRAAFAAWGTVGRASEPVQARAASAQTAANDGASTQDVEQDVTGQTDSNELEEESMGARALGIAAHAALEAVFGADDPESLEAEKAAAESFERVLNETGDGRLETGDRNQQASVLARVMALARSEWGRSIAALTAEERRVETPFRWRVTIEGGARVTLTGQIDLMAKLAPEKWQVVDYKLASARGKSSESETLTRYAWQAGLYARAAAEILKTDAANVEPALAFLRDDPLEARSIAQFGHDAFGDATLRAALAQFAESSRAANPLERIAQVWFPKDDAPRARNAELCRAHGCAFVGQCFGSREQRD